VSNHIFQSCYVFLDFWIDVPYISKIQIIMNSFAEAPD